MEPSRMAGSAPDLAPEMVAEEVATAAASTMSWRPGPSQHVPPPPPAATAERQRCSVAKASAKELPLFESEPPRAAT